MVLDCQLLALGGVDRCSEIVVAGAPRSHPRLAKVGDAGIKLLTFGENSTILVLNCQRLALPAVAPNAEVAVL